MKTLRNSPGSSLSRLIALPAHRSPGSSLSRLIALLLLILPLIVITRPSFAQAAPRAVSLAVGSDGLTWLLWNDPDGSVALWKIGADGSVADSATYGPYSGWNCPQVAIGGDNEPRLFWHHVPDGQSSIWVMWSVDGTGTFISTPAYGPYGGWTAGAMSAGTDNSARLLWQHAPDRQFSLWTVDTAGNIGSTPAFGPIPGWSAAAIATGSDSRTRLLLNNDNGSAVVWTVDAAGDVTSTPAYGPISGWNCRAVAVGGDTNTRLLWTTTGGAAAIWTLDSAGNVASTPGYGPVPSPAGPLTAATLAVGSDNAPRLLWAGTDGSAQIWRINPDGTYTPTTYSAVPTGLTATPGDGSVALDWTGPAAGGDSYNLYRGTSPGGEGAIPVKRGLNSTPYLDTGLADGVTYYYQVTAVTGNQEGSPSAEVAVTPQPPAPPPASRLTQAQAVSLAQTFCQAVGAPVTANATATWPAPNPYPGQPPYHWQARWHIQFATQAEVEVVDATGVISHYYNFALSRQLQSTNAPAGTPISEASAVQAAASALQASGQSGELASSSTDQNFQITNPPTQAGDLWMVTWGRQYQGIPYRQQQATVMLQAETGALQAFSLSFPSPPPAAGPGSVTSSQAVQTAQTTLANAGYSNLTQQSVTLQVITPNSQWQTGAATVSPTPGRIAWNCVFTNANNTVYEVWVDSYSANSVDGGEVYGIAGKHRPEKQPKAAVRRKTPPHIKLSEPSLPPSRAAHMPVKL